MTSVLHLNHICPCLSLERMHHYLVCPYQWDKYYLCLFKQIRTNMTSLVVQFYRVVSKIELFHTFVAKINGIKLNFTSTNKSSE